jgi:hypothetical protein
MTTSNKLRRPYRKLTDIRVDEISAVMEGAGVGTKIMLRKSRDAAFAKATERLALSVRSILTDPACDRDGMLAKTFTQFQQHLERLTKNDSERSEPDLSDTNAGYGGRRRRRSDDDDETERLSDDADADDGDEKEKAMTAKLKSLDAVQICKQMVAEEDAHSMSEHDLVALIDNYAKAHDTTFVKIYETDVDVRKAVNLAKQAQFVSKLAGSTPHFLADGSNPVMSPGKASLKPRSSGVSGKPAQQGVNNPRLSIAQLQALIDAQRAEADDNEEENGEAYEKLCKLASDMHAEQPHLTFEKCFEKIYLSSEHRELATAERLANRPRASW